MGQQKSAPWVNLASAPTPKAHTFLKTIVTFLALDALALSITDNEAVERVNKARTKLFDKIRLARKRA